MLSAIDAGDNLKYWGAVLATTADDSVVLVCWCLQGGHPLFRNLPGARQNMGAYGRPQPGMGPGGRVITGGPNRGYGAGQWCTPLE